MKPALSEECYHRIQVATVAVENALGAKVTSFRCPRLWGSTAVVNALERLGYTADASYPMYFYKERLVPYHPSSEDWTQEGNMKLLEIPNFADMTMDSHDQYGRDRDQWPLFRTEGAEAMMAHVESMLDFYKERNLPPVFCFYMHPWEFWDMPQGIIHYGEGAVVPDHTCSIVHKFEEFVKGRGYGENLLYGPCHGLGMIEVERPWIESSSDYLLQENMTFQVDTFLYRKEYGLRWEDGVRITKDGVEEFSTRFRRIFEVE